MPTAIDSQIGPYRLKRKIGSGGFGDVFLAEHTTKRTQVALKLLHSFLHNDEEQQTAYTEAIADFQQELQVLQRMQHTNIVHVLDSSLEEELPYVAMEYCPNGSLARRAPLGVIYPMALIVKRVRQVASALHYAHQQGIIHRDVKPQNMLFGINEEILLSDFGLAMMMRKDESDAEDPYYLGGTLYYMAPEQFFGRPVPASDQYALGVTVYNWLSGRFPFYGSPDDFADYHRGTEPPIPLHTQIPDLPAAIEAVVMRALTRDPDQRYPDIIAFADALEEANQTSPDFYALPPGWEERANAQRWADQALALNDAKRYEEAKEACSRSLEINPQFHGAYMTRALMKFGLKDYPDALADLTHAIELAPDASLAYKYRALVYDKLNQFENAVADLTHLLEIDDADAGIYNNRGRAYQGLEEYQLALADLDTAIALSPRFALAYANRASLYRDLDELQKAMDDVEYALELEPNLVLALNEQAMTFHNLGLHDQALACLRRAQEIEPDDLQTWVALGGIYYDLEEYEQARAAFSREVELDGTLVHAWYLLGCISVKLEEYARAIEEHSEAIKLDPMYTSSWHDRAILLYMTGQYEQSLADFETLFELAPTNEDYWSEFSSLLVALKGGDLVRDMLLRVISRHPTLPEAWYYLGMCSSYNDRLVATHQQFSRAIRFKPDYATAYAMRALCNMEMKHYNSALVDCRKASTLDADYYLPWYTSGSVFLEIGQYDRAYKAFTEALARDPRYATSWYRRALAAYRSGNYTQAIADCTQVLTLKDQYAEAYLTRAQSHQELGQLTEALVGYHAYLELKADDGQAWKQLGQVYEALGDSSQAAAAYQQAAQLMPADVPV